MTIYLSALEDAGAPNVDALLAGHLVDPGLLRALRNDRADLDLMVERFLDDRRSRIISAFEAALSADLTNVLEFTSVR